MAGRNSSDATDDPELARRIEMGRRIESARQKLGMQKGELAEALGVSAATYTGWIQGKHSMRNANLARLVEITGEPSSFFTPEPMAKQDTIERLARKLGARIGKARIEKRPGDSRGRAPQGGRCGDRIACGVSPPTPPSRLAPISGSPFNAGGALVFFSVRPNFCVALRIGQS